MFGCIFHADLRSWDMMEGTFDCGHGHYQYEATYSPTLSARRPETLY